MEVFITGSCRKWCRYISMHRLVSVYNKLTNMYRTSVTTSLLLVFAASAALVSPKVISSRNLLDNRNNMKFPEVKFTYKQDVLIRSRLTGNYLAITKNDQGQTQFVTKESENIEGDTDLHFMLYYFNVAEPKETTLILPFHRPTNTYIRMTNSQELVLQNGDEFENNSIPGSITPRDIKEADSRFFYVRSSGYGEEDYVLEAMNGVDYGYFLSVPEANQRPKLHKHLEGDYPNHIVLQIFSAHQTD